jgi:hypothetical protein
MKSALWFTSLAQVALLAVQYPAGPQLLLGAVLCAVIVSLLWHVRRAMPPHADMLLIMTAFGGFGMVVGGYGQPTCHHSWTGTLGMLVASLPPSLWFARCLQVPARLALLLADTVGMLVGMECGHWLAAGADPWTRHTAMLLGMNLGMTLRFLVPWPLLRLDTTTPRSNNPPDYNQLQATARKFTLAGKRFTS